MLLFALGWKLRLGAGFDKTFRKAIRDAERTVVIRTQDGRSAFSYVFHDGRVSAHRGILEDATVQLVWDDPRIAVRAMLSKNPLDTFSAIGKGDLAIEGNLQDALWFNDLAG